MRRAAAAALMVATTGASLLAVDNLLGFVGTHLIAAGPVLMVAAISVSAGVMAAAGAVLARGAVHLVFAAATVVFVAALSPATSSQLWLPIAVILQALVPLAFAAAGLLALRGSRNSTAVRVLAVMLVGFAAAWIVTAFIPVALVAFLLAQAGTLVVGAVLSLQPILRRARSLARALWSSAEVR
ncbi:hypothetical protein NYS50_14375 [Curtobacterium flaccumfaciens pv. flaccumfaciens]|uniref:hypothetical protein n=1 Tax=Curtobacterium flaccumfaciens TaxID=2035 RepID=UPI00217D169A|nr:hypothetical protein [Curtobacterium flaccumfaciens]MCS6549065.1 hypothetical protein [Curtobacterium flaccumfaciens pv. flaccumfaciens]